MTKLRLKTLGHALRLEYRRNGRRYVHEFDAKAELGGFREGDALVIAPVAFDGRGYIQDKKTRRTPAKKKTRRKTAKKTARRTRRKR